MLNILIEAAVCLSIDPLPSPTVEFRPLSRRMSAPGLTQSAQVRYLIQWFGEFSELQREDFLPVLVAARSGDQDVLANALQALSCDDKPVSLFQCRIKLFNEWFPSWPKQEQEQYVTNIGDLDKEFGKKLNKTEATMNGNLTETNGFHTTESSDDDCAKEEPEDQVASEALDVQENNIQDNIPIEIAAAS